MRLLVIRLMFQSAPRPRGRGDINVYEPPPPGSSFNPRPAHAGGATAALPFDWAARGFYPFLANLPIPLARKSLQLSKNDYKSLCGAHLRAGAKSCLAGRRLGFAEGGS